MGKFSGILFCTDLDGTLLGSDRKISEENTKAIEYFKSEGGKFTFITGRLPFFTHEMYNAVNPNAPVGCGNGCCVYDFEKNEYLWQKVMPLYILDLIGDILKVVPEMGVQVNTFERVIFCNDNEPMQWFRKITSMPNIQMPYTDIKEPVSKIAIGDTDFEKIEKARKIIENSPYIDEIEFVRSEKYLYDILQKGLDKGTLLEKIAEILDISMDRTIAIGDFNNDVGMIKKAKLGIAVANASPMAKEVADLVTVSNDENAVAKIIWDIDRGIIKI